MTDLVKKIEKLASLEFNKTVHYPEEFAREIIVAVLREMLEPSMKSIDDATDAMELLMDAKVSSYETEFGTKDTSGCAVTAYKIMIKSFAEAHGIDLERQA